MFLSRKWFFRFAFCKPGPFFFFSSLFCQQVRVQSLNFIFFWVPSTGSQSFFQPYFMFFLRKKLWVCFGHRCKNLKKKKNLWIHRLCVEGSHSIWKILHHSLVWYKINNMPKLTKLRASITWPYHFHSIWNPWVSNHVVLFMS